MKKGSKKWRAVQKQKEEGRVAAMQNAGEPFSKAQNRKLLCLHYGGTPGGFFIGHCYSLLTPLNENECQCSQCGKVFSMDQYQQMEQLVHYLTYKNCLTDIELIEELSRGIEPVYFRRLSETEIEILDTVEGQVIMPRHFAIY